MASRTVALPPGFVMLEQQPQAQPQLAPARTPQLPPGFEMVPTANPTVMQELAVTEAQPRTGDFLKPYFGGHNPIAETYDTFVEPFTEVSSDRPIVDRVLDTVSFAGSVPFQAFRLPSPGQLGEQYLGDPSLREREENFAENNPKIIRALGAAGEVAPGITPGLGQGVTNIGAPVSAGARQAEAAIRPRPAIARQISEDTQRARQSAQNMRDLDINPYGPAVAAARRGDNSAGAVTQALSDKPIIGGPLQRGARQYVEETVDAFDRIRGQYGAEADIQTAGGRIKAAVNENRSVRDADIKAMSDDQLRKLANSPVRAESYRDVQSAKYELAERLMPAGKLGRKPVGQGQTRDMALPGNTQRVLLQIKDRKGQTINKSAGKSGKLSTKDFDFENPNWTNNRDLNQSLDVLAESPSWRAGIAGIREIRSMVRRTKAGMKGDNEVRALAKGDLKRLEQSLTKDLYGLFGRVIADEAAAGRMEIANQYRAAFKAMREADDFTNRYETQIFAPLRRILHEDITPGNAANEILSAMKDGTRGNIQRLAALSRVLPREALDDFAGAVLRELARPLKGAPGAAQESGVQLSKLVSEWRSLNPRARRIIFGRDPQKLQQMERLISVAENLKDFERLANNSRTGVSNAALGLVAAGGYSLSMLSVQLLSATIGLGVLGWGTSKFLASPAYVAWLERSARIGSAPRKARVGHMRRLQQIVLRDTAMPADTAQSLLVAINRAIAQEEQEPSPTTTTTPSEGRGATTAAMRFRTGK